MSELTKEKVKDAIYTGNLVKCEQGEYHSWVRNYLQEIAGEFADYNDGLRAMIALEEVRRLDAKHGSNI